jgi:hypothetical protein
MTNPAKNSATPKTVAEAAEKQTAPIEETVVPAQATSPKTETNTDKVVDHTNKTLFAGTTSEIVAWLTERSEMVYAIRLSGSNDLTSSIDYLKKHQEKLSPVQRLKAAAEKLGKNRKAMLILGASAVVAGLAVKNSRKAVKVEVLDEDDTTINGVGEDDETPDSL